MHGHVLSTDAIKKMSGARMYGHGCSTYCNTEAGSIFVMYEVDGVASPAAHLPLLQEEGVRAPAGTCTSLQGLIKIQELLIQAVWAAVPSRW